MTEAASYLSVSVSTFVVAELFLLLISLPWLSNMFRPWFEFRDKHSSLDLALAELAERYAYLGVYHNEWEDRGIRAELTHSKHDTCTMFCSLHWFAYEPIHLERHIDVPGVMLLLAKGHYQATLGWIMGLLLRLWRWFTAFIRKSPTLLTKLNQERFPWHRPPQAMKLRLQWR